MTVYYGVYVTTNNTGHSKKIASKPQEKQQFPPNIAYDGSNYRFLNYYQVSTPSQEKAFQKFCEDNHIETEILID